MDLKPLDYPIILGAIIIIVIYSYTILSTTSESSLFYIKSGNKRFVYTQNMDKTIVIAGPLGQSIILIENGKARFISSPCKDQICVQMGDVDILSDIAACLPNKIIIGMEGDTGESDAHSY